jgi:hypothetical protein
VVAVKDLPSVVAAMKDRGLQFRSDIVAGPGGKQIQLLDPDGNPVEIVRASSAHLKRVAESRAAIRRRPNQHAC